MEREITDGDVALGKNPSQRLLRCLMVCAVLGVLLALRFPGDPGLGTKVLISLGATSVGFAAWGYLELRNFCIVRAQTGKRLGWRMVAMLLHPVMLPVYGIVMPIAILIISRSLGPKPEGYDIRQAPVPLQLTPESVPDDSSGSTELDG